MSVEPIGHGPGGGKPASAPRAQGTALVRVLPQPKAAASGLRRTRAALWVAGMVAALGLGTVGVRVVQASGTGVSGGQIQAEASAQALQRLEDEVARLQGSVDSLRTSADVARQDEPLRGLRRSVDGLKQEIDQVKASSGANLAQLSTRIEKADHDPAPKLAEIMARLDKLDRDPPAKVSDASAQKLAEVQSRLERVEKQVSSPATTGSLPPASRSALPPVVPIPVSAPMASASPPVKLASVKADLATRPAAASSLPSTPTAPVARTVVAKTDAAPVKSASYVLREVYDGLALVEARGGDLREVAPGEYLPGMGEVRSIERRGHNWVVLTSRGAIENGTW